LSWRLKIGRPRKKETDEKALARITHEVVEASPDVASMGVILGCLDGDVKALELLRKECESIDEFLSLAGQIAHVKLISAATKSACGYEFDEKTIEYKKIPVGYDTNNKPQFEYIDCGEKTVRKHYRASDSLMKFLLSNRVPQYFSDTRRVEINKRVIEIKEDTEKEIKVFAGKLLEAITVDAEFVDEPIES